MIKRVFADYPLVIIALLLSAYGIAVVYSAGQTDVVQTSVATAYQRQLGWFVVALVGAWVLSRVSVRLLEWASWPVYLFAIFLLIVTLVFGSGAGTAASMKGWLTIGGVRLGQPAEVAKVTVVLMLAKVLAVRRDAPRSLLELWKPAAVVLVPWVLVMAQPDLGTGMVFVGIFFAMLFWAGVSGPLLLLAASPAISLLLSFSTVYWGAWFLILIAVVLWYKPYVVEGVVLIVTNVAMGVLAPIVWEKLAPHQKSRLLVFLDPSIDPRASGYHVIQSQVAIGSGGIFGKGFTDGSQKRLAFLPEQYTDFIFPVVGEELGFIGVSIALGLFCVLLLRTVRIASRSSSPFASLVAFGLTAAWFTHIVVNIGMTVGLMPITGIPLPFVSQGGSSVLASFVALGLVQSVHMHRFA